MAFDLMLRGHSVSSTAFQETFFRPTAPTASPSVQSTTSTSPNREQQQLGGHADLAVNQHWLDVFRKAKQKYLEEQDHLHLSSTNHLYDNHRARAQKKMVERETFKEKPEQQNRAPCCISNDPAIVPPNTGKHRTNSKRHRT